MRSALFAVAAFLGSTSGSLATDLKLGNWNIQTLVYAGDPHTVFPDDYVRNATDFADLKHWRDLAGADVYFLQEVSSPAAINEVFPTSEGWEYCISGQFAKDEATGTGPVCTKSGTSPAKPAGTTRSQYTAVAWRTQAGVKIGPVEDYSALNVKSVDNDGTIRDVRWGLDVSLSAGSTSLRVLVVHMKSGCFDDRVNFRLFTVDPATTPPVKDACETLGRQMYPLHAWISERETAGDAWMVVGDFNRRLDAGAGRNQDEVLQAITAYSPGADGHDRDNRPDIIVYRAPYKVPSSCWADTSNALPMNLADADNYNMLPIEFFLFGKTARAKLDPASERQLPWLPSTAVDPKRLSDHCPSTIMLRGQ
ncbi:hypothetical protein KHC17_25285 (plasmid) [Agrobacterium salinitolerans]|uniref:hypothetical protein n=1 Tax=Agrobacterium salinitolerans TaxID=1183413 RepID=UPI001C21D127|nr:hypothetical protein [Agrobacterium salinitolerans]QXC52450.1 hypothetical protein KHC17_25285 [Agrobacterium salinitolerans]